MNNLAKHHLTWIGTALLCVSCTMTQERTFEQVISARFDSGGKLFGAYRTFYCGSDSDYDYYTCTSFPTRHYKVKTTPHWLYPSTVPFKGWLMCERYYFSVYRGRIVIKSFEQHERLQQYRNRPGCHYSLTSTREELEEMNSWCLKNWGSERLRIPDANTGYAQPEWSFLQENTKPPYTPEKTDSFTYDDPRF